MNHHSDSDMTVGESGRTLLQSKAVLNPGTDNELKITGYRYDVGKAFLYYMAVVCTLGIILLVQSWKPELLCFLRCKECPLYSADIVLIRRPILGWRVCLWHTETHFGVEGLWYIATHFGVEGLWHTATHFGVEGLWYTATHFVIEGVWHTATHFGVEGLWHTATHFGVKCL
ncbi:hypothetical protein ACOMHN_045524 [Nucella lapillus]